MSEIKNEVKSPPTDSQLKDWFKMIGRDNVFRMVHNHLRDLAQLKGGKYYDAFQNFQSAEALSKD